jgi:hypothetical protein
MPVPNFIYDGDMTIATQDGAGTWVLPFEGVGDTQSFEYIAYFTQLAANYLPLRNAIQPLGGYEVMQTIVTARGTAYLVEESDINYIAPGLIRFKRRYVSLPVTRYEGNSFVYPIQFLSTTATYVWDSPPAEPTVAELPLTINGRIKYEYSLTKPDVIYAPKVAVVFGTTLTFGGWGALVDGQEYAAFDSEISIYVGGIWQRKTQYFVNKAAVT